MDCSTRHIRPVTARVTVLATGGCGKVYLYTTNPDVATGDGIAMAYRAGVAVANLEFMQFHPTCLYHPRERSFLLSEALRGEVAYTGLHGANRLASNSLLEALVSAHHAVEAVRARLDAVRRVPRAEAWSARGTRPPLETVVFDHNWDAVRRVLWDLVGIVRTDERLAVAARHLDLLLQESEQAFDTLRLSPDLVELRNIALVGSLIVRCARKRKESRGLHYNLDHPRPVARLAGRPTQVRRRGDS